MANMATSFRIWQRLAGFNRACGEFALAALAGAVVFSVPARSADKLYDWSNDQVAVESAETIARTCLEEFDSYQHRNSCIVKPSEVCRSQYDGGQDNQFDTNRCVAYEADAWDRILDDVHGRLLQSEDAPEGIQRSQSMWKAWSDFDCEIRSSYIGTMAALDFSSCRAKHAADRVIELMYLLHI